jgi:hypothetical protein
MKEQTTSEWNGAELKHGVTLATAFAHFQTASLRLAAALRLWRRNPCTLPLFSLFVKKDVIAAALAAFVFLNACHFIY